MNKPQIPNTSFDVIKRSNLVKVTFAISTVTIICSFIGVIPKTVALLLSEFSIFVAVILALIFHYDIKVNEQNKALNDKIDLNSKTLLERIDRQKQSFSDKFDKQTKFMSEQLDAIKKPIEIFSKLHDINDGGRTINQFSQIVDSLSSLKNKEIILNMQLMSLELLTKSLLSGNKENQFSIMLSSTPEEVYLSINKFIELLPRNSIYKTVSCLHFWNEKTIGHPIPYLAKNKALSKTNNIRFERVILVGKIFSKLKTDEQKVILAHKEYNSKPTKIKTKIYVLNDPQKFEKIGNFALCYLPNNDTIILDFKYNFYGGIPSFREVSYKSVEDKITSQSGLEGAKLQDLEERFIQYFEDDKSMSLDDYINGKQ